jgi:transposase-like protein
VPAKITIDGSEANATAIRGYNEAHGTSMIIRQVQYLNHVVEQDHRAVKRVTRLWVPKTHRHKKPADEHTCDHAARRS